MTSIQNDNAMAPAAMLEQLESAPGVFRRALGDRSAEELRAPGQDGGVAVVEIMSHMQDWEEITGERISLILREHHPELQTWDDSLWSIEHGYADRDAWQVLEAFGTLRTALVAMLRDASEYDWQRTAELPGHGTITIAWLMDRVIRHDAKHIQQIVDALS